MRGGPRVWFGDSLLSTCAWCCCTVGHEHGPARLLQAPVGSMHDVVAAAAFGGPVCRYLSLVGDGGSAQVVLAQDELRHSAIICETHLAICSYAKLHCARTSQVPGSGGRWRLGTGGACAGRAAAGGAAGGAEDHAPPPGDRRAKGWHSRAPHGKSHRICMTRSRELWLAALCVLCICRYCWHPAGRQCATQQSMRTIPSTGQRACEPTVVYWAGGQGAAVSVYGTPPCSGRAHRVPSRRIPLQGVLQLLCSGLTAANKAKLALQQRRQHLVFTATCEHQGPLLPLSHASALSSDTLQLCLALWLFFVGSSFRPCHRATTCLSWSVCTAACWTTLSPQHRRRRPRVWQRFARSRSSSWCVGVAAAALSVMQILSGIIGANLAPTMPDCVV